MEFHKQMKMIAFLIVVAMVAAFALSSCTEAGNDNDDSDVISFTDDFSAIPFDVDGDGDTTYTYDGESIDDVLNPAGGRILTYDPDGDGVADLVDGMYLRLVSGRFYLDEGDSDYDGLTDEIDFTADAEWYLLGSVFIGENDAATTADRSSDGSTVLDVEEGTTVYGIASASMPGTLVIDRNGQINAVGTADDPIVFTSSKAAGNREPGDWGGIVINGNAVVQGGTATGEGSTGTYGGTLAADDSGTIQYAQVQFAGTLFTPDNELNGIAFQAVGSGSTIDHIQVHMNADDGIEFFGGSVRVSYVVLTGNEDDSLDFDDGWNGSAQYVVIQQYPGGDYAIEGDGDAVTGGVDEACPILANFTIIGPTTADDVDGGPSFKENADPDFYNSIIVNYENATPALKEATDTGEEPTVEYFGIALEAGTSFSGSAAEWDSQVGSNGNVAVANGAAATWPSTDHIVDATLSSGSYAFNAVPTSVDAGTAQTVPTTDVAGNTVVNTSYLGALEAGSTTAWTDGWTAFPAN